MLLKITFLGTSGTVPSVERNPSSILIQYGNTRILFDCGEGTQRQMMVAKTGFKLDSIFITHIHTDHFLGIFGLLETLSLNERKEMLRVYINSNWQEFLRHVFKIFGYENLSFPVEVIGLNDGDEVKFEKFKILAFETEHIVKSLGFALIENERPGKFHKDKALEHGIPPGPLFSELIKGNPIEINGKTIYPEMVVGESRPGRKVVYTGDTRPNNRTVDVAKNSDVLIHDCSFSSELKDWAKETKHSTAKEAASTAKEADVKLLFLTHISARYSKEPNILLDEAKEIFKDSRIAEDLLSYEVKMPD